MKTSMQELIEYCEYRQTKAADGCKSAWNMILAKIKDDGLLERERDQIIDAYQYSYGVASFKTNTTADQYFNETFKNNNKMEKEFVSYEQALELKELIEIVKEKK